MHDDEDIFSTLLKYEKEVRAEKKEKKHFERKKKELGKVLKLSQVYIYISFIEINRLY